MARISAATTAEATQELAALRVLLSGNGQRDVFLLALVVDRKTGAGVSFYDATENALVKSGQEWVGAARREATRVSKCIKTQTRKAGT